jgi:hypothetical protein
METKEILVLVAAIGVSAALYAFSSQKTRRHLPPGLVDRQSTRHSIPICLVRVLQMEEGVRYVLHILRAYTLSDRYVDIGNVVYAHTLGQSFIILNSLKDVNELLDKRAENYLDRPSLVMAGELMGINNVSCELEPATSALDSSVIVPDVFSR